MRGLDGLASDLYQEICSIPLIDPHTHINPLAPTARNLAEILDYHYYTELAHSCGLDKKLLGPEHEPRDRVRAILRHASQFDNTVQYQWLVEIAREFLGYTGERLTDADTDWLWDAAERTFAAPDWEERVLQKTNLEKAFLTNDFDDPLSGFDTGRYVPCLRADELVFHLGKREVRERLAQATGVDAVDAGGIRRAVTKLFDRFVAHGAKACAVSLPPDFTPQPISNDAATGVFWILAECCREFRLPFDLMIGVNRSVYAHGVHQGRDLFDQRWSLRQYAELFNSFPDVTFCVSVLSSMQNQELAAYSWIFPNVVTSGHWWYSNVPVLIESDLRLRLQAVPKVKQIGYYSDIYKLEFALPKYNMYRRILATVLADDFVRPGVCAESQAVDIARCLLRDNVQRIFHLDS